MTTELTIQNLFDGKPIRVIERDNDLWLPLEDIAAAWGIDRSTPQHIIRRNKESFAGFVSVGDVTSSEGGCLNERGVYLLIGKISTSRLKNPLAKESIIRFQRWVPELIQKYRKKEIVQVPKGPDYPGIIERMKFVRAVHEETGWNLLELQKEVLREAGMISLTYHIEPEKPVALPAPKPKDYLTATDIGERIDKSAQEVNTWLYQHKPPLLIKDLKGEYRLTPFGKEFGSEQIYEITGGTFVWRIRWKKDVLRLFNIFEHEEMG